MELRNYLRKPVTDLKTDVIKFWCDQKTTCCTNLWKIALRHVAIMSTSVPLRTIIFKHREHYYTQTKSTYRRTSR